MEAPSHGGRGRHRHVNAPQDQTSAMCLILVAMVEHKQYGTSTGKFSYALKHLKEVWAKCHQEAAFNDRESATVALLAGALQEALARTTPEPPTWSELKADCIKNESDPAWRWHVIDTLIKRLPGGEEAVMRARAELKGQQTTAMEDHKPSASAGEREGKGEGATAMREAVSDSEDEPLFVPSTATSKRSKAAADSALLASCSASSLLHIPKRVKPGIAPVSGAGEVEAASNVADGADDSDDNLFGQRAARKAAAISTPSATTSASTDQATPPVVALPPPLPTPPAPVLHRPSHRRHVSDSEVDYDDESESSEEGERGRYSSASSSTGTYYSDSASSDAQTNSGSEEGSESGGSSGSSIISGSVSGGGSASAGSALPMEGSDGEEGEEEWDENEEEGEEDWEGEEGDWGEEQGEEEAPPANATHVLLPPVGWTPAAMGGQTESFGGGDEAGLAAVEGGFEVEDEWLRAADMDHARSRIIEGYSIVRDGLYTLRASLEEGNALGDKNEEIQRVEARIAAMDEVINQALAEFGL